MVLADVTTNKKLIDKIADGLSVMDKNAEIQRDKKGNILYDKETKDTEVELEQRFLELEKSVNERIAKLFG